MYREDHTAMQEVTVKWGHACFLLKQLVFKGMSYICQITTFISYEDSLISGPTTLHQAQLFKSFKSQTCFTVCQVLTCVDNILRN